MNKWSRYKVEMTGRFAGNEQFVLETTVPDGFRYRINSFCVMNKEGRPLMGGELSQLVFGDVTLVPATTDTGSLFGLNPAIWVAEQIHCPRCLAAKGEPCTWKGPHKLPFHSKRRDKAPGTLNPKEKIWARGKLGISGDIRLVLFGVSQPYKPHVYDSVEYKRRVQTLERIKKSMWSLTQESHRLLEIGNALINQLEDNLEIGIGDSGKASA